MTSFENPSENIQRDCSTSLENFHFSNPHLDKEFKHLLETVLSYDPEVEKDLEFMSIFREVIFENGIDELILLSKDELPLHHHQSE